MFLALTLVSALTFPNQLQTLNHLLPSPKTWIYREECHIGKRAFTGTRILHVRTLNVPTMDPIHKQTVLLQCELGTPLYNVTLNSVTAIFNQDINTIGDNYIRMARRPAYATSQKLKYVPGTVVGAVYARESANFSETTKSPETSKDGKYLNGTNQNNGIHNWIPLTPLIADHWDTFFHHSGYHDQTAELIIVTSLLRSPEPLDKTYPKNDKWTQYVNPIEPPDRKDINELEDEDLPQI